MISKNILLESRPSKRGSGNFILRSANSEFSTSMSEEFYGSWRLSSRRYGKRVLEIGTDFIKVESETYHYAYPYTPRIIDNSLFIDLPNYGGKAIKGDIFTTFTLVSEDALRVFNGGFDQSFLKIKGEVDKSGLYCFPEEGKPDM